MKTITKFDFNTNNIHQDGEVRKFNIYGDKDSVFSLEILNEDSYYYNFKTQEFTSKVYRIDHEVVRGVSYSGEVVFPAVTDADHYDVRLWAHDTYDTKHATYKEIRLDDGSIDINSSSGSNSNLLFKKIYQYLNITVTLSAIAYHPAAWGGAITPVAQTFLSSPLSPNNKKHSFTVSASIADDKGIALLRQPLQTDIVATESRQYGTAVPIPNEDPFEYARPLTTTVNGATSGSNRIVLDETNANLGLLVGDAISVGSYTDKTVLITHLDPDTDNTSEIQVSEEITLSDEAVITFYYKGYYRWNVHATSSLHGITTGMRIFQANGYFPYIHIAPYSRRSEITLETDFIKSRKSLEIDSKEILPKSSTASYIDYVNYKAVEPTLSSLTYTTGVISKQLGIITHERQQEIAVENAAFKIYAYGSDQISSLTNCKTIFTNLKAELQTLTTTTTGTVSNSTTVGVADRSGIINNVTRIKGIGIDASSAAPLVTAGGGNDGAGNLTISTAQTIENGQTLTLLGTGSSLVITGQVEFEKFPEENTSLYFDVSKFLLTN